ncbi:MAG TPA: VOC family protein, partial [Acidimicrobiales bacterium]|nr:VOC family protein [Acidimicrobiales bacterium]
MIDGADLNHVAVAAESRADLEVRYATQLGGHPRAEGPSPGFVWAQLVYSNGMVVEMLEPAQVEDNDFLRRFLDRNGPGPHHLTFTVPDFGAALDAVRTSGYSPVAVNDSDPAWKEAFLHPKDATGVVVQLAEAHEEADVPPDGAPDAGPAVAPLPAAVLVHVAHAVRSLEDGLRLFGSLLDGTVIGEGRAPDHRWLDVRWPGPGRVRLMTPTGPGPVDAWLG